MTNSAAFAGPPTVGIAYDELGIVQALLLSNDPGAVDAAHGLLLSVEAQLGFLASAEDTDTDTAGWLLSVRTDLSGHLLAAGALETAGAPADGVARMLRRAADAALAALARQSRAPVGAGRL